MTDNLFLCLTFERLHDFLNRQRRHRGYFQIIDTQIVLNEKNILFNQILSCCVTLRTSYCKLKCKNRLYYKIKICRLAPNPTGRTQKLTPTSTVSRENPSQNLPSAPSTDCSKVTRLKPLSKINNLFWFLEGGATGTQISKLPTHHQTIFICLRQTKQLLEVTSMKRHPERLKQNISTFAVNDLVLN